jgi:hypothetical protein
MFIETAIIMPAIYAGIRGGNRVFAGIKPD